MMLSQLQTIKQTLPLLWPIWRKVFVFGFFTSLMVLAPSWYMLEVYDRVINSRNITTLAMLTVLVTFIYVVMEALEWQRRKMLQAAAKTFEQSLQAKLFESSFAAKLSNPAFPIQQVFSDFSSLKNTLNSSAFLGLMDAPFCLIFLVVVFLIHPVLGVLTLLGLAIQLFITLNNQLHIEPQMKLANEHAIESQRYFSSVTQHSDVVTVMDMLAPIQQKWLQSQHGFLWNQAQASELAGKNAAISKFLQTLQSSVILGVACYLVIAGELLNGGAMMIVASILAARVLAPLVQLVSHWKMLVQARASYIRLESLFAKAEKPVTGMTLPAPSGEVTVDNVSYAVDSLSQALFIRNVQLQLAPGNVLVIAGASASGKTTLGKLLVGLLPPTSGRVRLDGVDVYAWNKQSLGPHIGYLSQEVDLFDGTIAENICRFGAHHEQAMHDVVTLLGLNELLSRFPNGLDTVIGREAAYLSGGERQLIGLARALYGAPKVVVLDEPNANLDTAGEKALYHAIASMKQQGTTFVVISHLQHILSVADWMLVMMQGQMIRFGKPKEVLASFQTPSGKVASK
jgi:ATP-binding cassette subfamily C exporter for protease/lipase